jgi:hypothetical protein
MTFNPHSYEHIYGFELFDTVHNFFPEILYDDTLFSNDLENWVRYRMGMLFPAMYPRQQNLYRIYRSNSTREEYNNWRGGNIGNPIIHSFPSPPNMSPSSVPFSRFRTPPTQSRILRQPPIRTTSSPESHPRVQRLNRVVRTSPENILISILSTSIGMHENDEDVLPSRWNQYMDDVEVHPTPEQVSAASDIREHSIVQPETVCAICQDHESQISRENWRLLHCNHTFHISCIDSWFQRNVHCPVCRKDIREFSE